MRDREKRQTDRESKKQRKPETDTQKKKNQREADEKSDSTDTNRERPGAQEVETERWGQRDGERNADDRL